MDDVQNVLIDRSFASSRSELGDLPQRLESVRPLCPISDVQFYNLVVAMTEAVANAIMHGNKENPEKSVRYLLECREEGIRCVIEDEGEGFVPEEVADPTDPENLLREGGRGMFLIRALMQDVRVASEGGRTRVEFLCARG